VSVDAGLRSGGAERSTGVSPVRDTRVETSPMSNPRRAPSALIETPLQQSRGNLIDKSSLEEQRSQPRTEAGFVCKPYPMGLVGEPC
jgi:hypothetical protein